MDNFNSIVHIVKEAMPLVQSGIPALVGGFVTAMFLRGNTNRTEFEKIKVGRIKEALDDLVDSRELTLTELVKCKNMLEIAKLADTEYAKQSHEDETRNKEFDFDWFIRFFEAAGNISNEEMQSLWSKVLSNEVASPGKFTLRTLEVLRNMSVSEARLFEKIGKMVLREPLTASTVIFAPHTVGESNFKTRFGLNFNDFIKLFDCGILNPQSISTVTIDCGFCNDSLLLKFHNKKGKDDIFKYHCYTLTQAANQLLSIINGFSSNEYIMELGKSLKSIYSSTLEINIFKIINWNVEGIVVDDEIDLLDETSSQETDP